MIASLLITFREGVEASLIVGILLGFLKKTGQTQYAKYVWSGVVAAIVVSIAVAVAILAIGAELEGPAEPLFEGTMLFIAVGLVTAMIFWMRYQSRTLKSSLESEMNAAVQNGHPRALFATAFFAVVREGIETALFISAIGFTNKNIDTLAGSILGLVIAALVGYLIFASTLRLNLRTFFSITSVLLLVIAAGLFGRAIHEFIEIGLLPALREGVYNVGGILPAESTIGQVLTALFGYNAAPDLLEVIGYVGFLVVAMVGIPWIVDRQFQRAANRQPAPVRAMGD
ncbi:MAG: FTR1 family protein [Anaerolineae bacterium]|nr:FTR1 family protein [Anaerolineae bacterium]